MPRPLATRGRYEPAGLEPLSPERKWRAITIATLILAPAFWSILVGLIAFGSDDEAVNNQAAGAALAFGLALIPFVFIVLAFMSEHPRAPGAAAVAMAMCLLVGIPVSAVALDAVTGLVAGVGAGGIVALRSDPGHSWRTRALGVLFAALYAFVLVRVAAVFVLLPLPIFPLTAIGLADHLAERRAEREVSSA